MNGATLLIPATNTQKMRPLIKEIKQGVDRGMIVVKPFNPI
jgi:hypothetical protein